MNGQANINILNSKYNNNSFRVDYMCKDIKKTWGDEMSKLINVGYDNTINTEKVVSITSVSSSPTKKMIQKAKEKDLIIDATEGQKTVTSIIMESGHIVLSAIRHDTIRKRMDKNL